jgi:hypothetical protein
VIASCDTDHEQAGGAEAGGHKGPGLETNNRQWDPIPGVSDACGQQWSESSEWKNSRTIHKF